MPPDEEEPEADAAKHLEEAADDAEDCADVSDGRVYDSRVHQPPLLTLALSLDDGSLSHSSG
jgi:hypothetical protein